MISITDFENWKKTLSSRQRREVEEWYREQLRGYAIDEARGKIENQLSIQMEHDRLVGKIGTLFLENEDVSNKTNCRFVTFDPLCELGKNNADLLIFEPNAKVALVVEIKTGDRSPIKHLNKSKQVIDGNREYLQKIVNSEVRVVKYFLVVNSLSRAAELKNDCRANNFAVGYIENNEFHLHSSSALNLERLDSVLSQGVPLFVGDSVYIMLGSHDFHIISNTLIEIIRSRLRESIMSEDKLKVKEFTKKEFRETFQSLAFISSVESNSLYDRYINGKVDGLIREGIRSGLIVECGDEKTYRIYSQATISMGKIGKTMERKYIQYYIDRNKIKIAEDNAISRFDQKYGEKQMKLDV